SKTCSIWLAMQTLAPPGFTTGASERSRGTSWKESQSEKLTPRSVPAPHLRVQFASPLSTLPNPYERKRSIQAHSFDEPQPLDGPDYRTGRSQLARNCRATNSQHVKCLPTTNKRDMARDLHL